MNPRIAIIDHLYPQFLRGFYINPALPYEEELQRLLNFSFGTGDFYSRNLRALGWDAIDIIANSDDLQSRWAYEHNDIGLNNHLILQSQIKAFRPDVIFSQNLSLPIVKPENCILAGQCSCPLPPERLLHQYDVIFTSLLKHVEYFESIGVRAVYNPLAFDPVVLERAVCQRERIYDCVFIGGVGNPSHWRRGLEVLETVAREIPTFLWWGYGIETLSKASPLRDKYRGPAYGLDMYKILLQSKIVINRHGEVAQGYANNMRMFEATGCGAMLVTESAKNMLDFFSPEEFDSYESPDEAVSIIRHYLADDLEREHLAELQQIRTLADHTYAHRMKTISEVLTGMLCHA